VLSRLARRSRAWPGLGAPPLTAAGHLRGTPSSARRGRTGHLVDLQPLQIGLLHAGRGICGPTARRLGRRQPQAAGCRGIIRHFVQRHAPTAILAAHLNPHILPDAPPFERERLQTNLDHHIARQARTLTHCAVIPPHLKNRIADVCHVPSK